MAQAGWVDIHAEAEQAGNPGAVIGYSAVPAGETTYVRVPIPLTDATEVLYAVLHIDAGVSGEFEFPGPDAPVQRDSRSIVAAFRLLEPRASRGAAPAQTSLPTAAPTAVPTAVPTAAPTATTTRSPTSAAAPTVTAVATVTTGAISTATPSRTQASTPSAATMSAPAASPTPPPTRTPTAVAGTSTAAGGAAVSPTGVPGTSAAGAASAVTPAGTPGPGVLPQTGGSGTMAGPIVPELVAATAALLVLAGAGLRRRSAQRQR